MELNPCSNCGDTDIVIVDDYLYCMTLNCDRKTIYYGSSLQNAVDVWNSANPNAIADWLHILQQAMLQSLMQRYAVNGKISDVGMPVYDRECLKLLESQGVVSLSNGLYQPK